MCSYWPPVVQIDLDDPEFWHGGLGIIEEMLTLELPERCDKGAGKK